MEYTVTLTTTPGAGGGELPDVLLAPLAKGRTSVKVVGPVLGQDTAGRVDVLCQVEAPDAVQAASLVAQALRDAYASAQHARTWLVERIEVCPYAAE